MSERAKQIRAGTVSLDAGLVVDFHLAGNLAILGRLFPGRMLLSDFVEQELAEAAIHLAEAEVVNLNTEEEWEFFNTVRTSQPVLETANGAR